RSPRPPPGSGAAGRGRSAAPPPASGAGQPAGSGTPPGGAPPPGRRRSGGPPGGGTGGRWRPPRGGAPPAPPPPPPPAPRRARPPVEPLAGEVDPLGEARRQRDAGRRRHRQHEGEERGQPDTAEDRRASMSHCGPGDLSHQEPPSASPARPRGGLGGP